jgi:hypothetical protein
MRRARCGSTFDPPITHIRTVEVSASANSGRPSSIVYVVGTPTKMDTRCPATASSARRGW